MAESVAPTFRSTTGRASRPNRQVKIDDAPFGFGGAPLGNLFAPIADEHAVALVRAAHASGVRYFDTAPHYGNGLSEHRMGAALRELPRDEFLLSTKVGRLLIADPNAPRDQNGYVGALPFAQRWDYSFDGTLRSLDDSLQRLALARIDYVFIHDVARDAHGDAQPQRFRDAMEGAIPALARLKADGTIKGFGLGVNDWGCASTRSPTPISTSCCLQDATRCSIRRRYRICCRAAWRAACAWSSVGRSTPASSPPARGPPVAAHRHSITPPRRLPWSRARPPSSICAPRTALRSRPPRSSFRAPIRRWPACCPVSAAARSSRRTSTCPARRYRPRSGANCAATDS